VSEHFGISVGEAMSAACITMAPNRGGPREIIQGRVTGYLFENEVELVELTRAVFEGHHPEAIREMRRRAAEAAKRFSLEAFCRRWDQLIRELTQASRPLELTRARALV
jgi:glycosyltransferase involved in cell wall biosynthesis